MIPAGRVKNKNSKSQLAVIGADWGGGAIGGTPVVAGAWTEVWARTLTAQDNGSNGLTYVLVIPLAELSATSGTQIRLTMQGGATEGFELSGMWVGNGGGGDAYDFTGDQVQLKLATSNTIAAAADAVIVTDAANFVKDETNALVISFQFENAAADNMYRKSNAGETSTFWFKSAVDASTQNKTGYTDSSSTGPHLVTKVELFI